MKILATISQIWPLHISSVVPALLVNVILQTLPCNGNVY